MLSIFKRHKEPKTEIELDDKHLSSTPETKQSIFTRLKSGLAKTRQQFATGLGTIFLGKKLIDKDILEALETQLLLADLGITTTTEIIHQITQKVSRKEINDTDVLKTVLKQTLIDILKPVQKPLILNDDKPYMILVVGINGSGKTTSIGKIAHHFLNDGKKVMLAAGDTFRAAAIEQLQVWGVRNNVPVIAQQAGADTASVIYDAFQSATAKAYDVLIADTAGRLHTQNHLMEELKKVRRVVNKLSDKSPQEVLLVLDASIGQNALMQAKIFTEAVQVTGIVLTKLDGTAKGGIIFAIANQLKIPIRFIGVGERIDDLRPFDAEDFVEALFSENI